MDGWLTPGLTSHCLLPHSSILCMAKEKATITLDRAKAAAARDLLGIGTTSEVIDVALDRLIRAERLRADVVAYQRVPPTEDEIDLASFGDISGIGDDTDWEALYADDLSCPPPCAAVRSGSPNSTRFARLWSSLVIPWDDCSTP